MELNKEQIVIEIQSIIKALKVNNGWWENRGRGGWFNHDILEDALSLIKELTEENERLKANAKSATEILNFKFAYDCGKADTVREFAEKLKEGFRKYDRANWSVRAIIDQIAKEMLEE